MTPDDTRLAMPPAPPDLATAAEAAAAACMALVHARETVRRAAHAGSCLQSASTVVGSREADAVRALRVYAACLDSDEAAHPWRELAAELLRYEASSSTLAAAADMLRDG